MLAEITDHTGTWLLKQALSTNVSCPPISLESISTSPVDWPIVHWPSNACWIFGWKWSQTLYQIWQWIKLLWPLRALTASYQNHQFWKWQFSSNGQLLHQTAPDTSPWAAILIWTQCLQLMFSPTSPTNNIFKGPPATPSSTYHWHIGLPIPPQPSLTSSPLAAQYQSSLVAQFHTILMHWQYPLFGSIHILQPANWILHLSPSQ